jgi:hypothetical protein
MRPYLVFGYTKSNAMDVNIVELVFFEWEFLSEAVDILR